MKLVIKRIHAFLDYPVALALIFLLYILFLPYILDLGNSNPIVVTLFVATGIAVLILTLLIDHHLGAVRVVPYKIHLFVDFLVVVVFIRSIYFFF